MRPHQHQERLSLTKVHISTGTPQGAMAATREEAAAVANSRHGVFGFSSEHSRSIVPIQVARIERPAKIVAE